MLLTMQRNKAPVDGAKPLLALPTSFRIIVSDFLTA